MIWHAGTVSDLELLWTLPVLLWALRFAWRYRYATAARRGTTGGRRRMADIRCLRFLSLAVAMWAWGGVGLYAMTRPQAPRADDGAGLGALLLTSLLLLGPNVLGLVGEYVDWLEARLPPLMRRPGGA